MANIVSSRGYNSSYRGAQAPSAFYQVLLGDFGATAPAAPSLTYEAGSGSLATGTAYVEVTWITAEGVSLPSTQAAVAIAASTGAVKVAQPTVPTNGQTVIGWQIYSEGSSGAEALNTASASTSPSPVAIATTEGAETGFLIATTSVLVELYGTGAAVPTIDESGIQAALPSVPANSTVDYYFIVPNGGSLWKNYKPVYTFRPDSIAETSGIVLSLPLDCVSPLYPGATPATSTTSGGYTQVAVAPNTYMVMNSNLFVSTQAGTVNTAATFIGGQAFNVPKGTTVTDGSVTWLCLGKATLVRAHFGNVTGSAKVPTAMQYDLYES